MSKTTFTVEEVTQVFIAGTQFGAKMMREAAQYEEKTGKAIDQEAVANETTVALMTKLKDLGYEPEAPHAN